MEEKQRELSRFIVQIGQLLLAHGAESTLVNDLTRRAGIACGLDEVETSLSASSIVVTTVMNEHCITTARRCPDRGINMKIVTEIQHICIMLEHKVIDSDLAQRKLRQLKPERYNRWLVVVMIGLSCAAFARIAGGDILICLVTFFASSIGMIVRQELGHRHFNPFINFAVTAFVTTLISAQAEVFQIGSQPFIAMASSVLMLVPGFPLINSMADMLKGYIGTGIARFTMASLLIFSTCLGIVAAMTLTGAWEWIR